MTNKPPELIRLRQIMEERRKTWDFVLSSMTHDLRIVLADRHAEAPIDWKKVPWRIRRKARRFVEHWDWDGMTLKDAARVCHAAGVRPRIGPDKDFSRSTNGGTQ